MSEISPSIMCVDYSNLKETIKQLEELKVEYIHFDIMDGHFVPNLTMGPDFMNYIRSITNIPMDMHFMVDNPESIIDIFQPRQGDLVCVHQESTVHLQRLLQRIKDTGAQVGVSINPATPIEMIKHVLYDLDVVLIMTVNPGFAGQKLIPATLEKIGELKRIISELSLNIKIEVDGNVSFENAEKMKKMGADIFVVGTSSVFSHEMGLEEGINKLRKILSES